MKKISGYIKENLLTKSQTELSNELNISQSSISKLLKRMNHRTAIIVLSLLISVVSFAQQMHGKTQSLRDSSTKFATTAYVDTARSNYPATQSMGAIFQRQTNFADADIAVIGTTTKALSGSTWTISNTNATWTSDYVKLFPSYFTLLPKWHMRVVLKLKFTPSAGSTGIGLMILSNNTHLENSVKSYLNTSNSSNGVLTIAGPTGTTLGTSATNATNTLNDVLQFDMSLDDSTITETVLNLTTSSTATKTVTMNTTTTGPFLPNTCNFGIKNFGTVSYEIVSVFIESAAPRFANYAIIGDSKGMSVGASSFNGGIPHQLNAVQPIVLSYSDGAGTTTDLITRKREVLSMNPQKIVFMLGSNDIRYGATVPATVANIINILSWYQQSSTKVYWTLFPEDSTGGGVGQTGLKNWLSSATNQTTYGYTWIDCWTGLVGGTANIINSAYVNSDKVHPNQAGYNVIVPLISAVMTTADQSRSSAFRTYAPYLSPIGDSLRFNYAYTPAVNRVIIWDDSLNERSGSIEDSAGKVIISTNRSNDPPAANPSYGLYVTSGFVATGGINGGFLFQDRTFPATYIFNYMNNNTYRFNITGNDYTAVNTAGDWIFKGAGTPDFGYGGVSGIRRGIFIKKDQAAVGDEYLSKGYAFTVDSLTVTQTGSGPITSGGPAKILSTTISAASATNYTQTQGLYIEAPIAAANVTFLDNYSLRLAGGKLGLPAPTTAYPSILFPSGTAPTSPPNGGMYYDGTHLYFKPSGTAVDLLAGGSASSAAFTPTLTNTTNITAATLSLASYTTVGNNIHVMIGGSFNVTIANTISTLTFTLPVTATTTSQVDVGSSVIYCSTGPGSCIGHVSVVSGTTGTITFYPGAAVSAVFNIQMDYKTN